VTTAEQSTEGVVVLAPQQNLVSLARKAKKRKSMAAGKVLAPFA